MGMKRTLGIRFIDGWKGNDDGATFENVEASFKVFSTLCHVIGVSRFIKSVEYSSNWCGYTINVDECVRGTLIAYDIRLIAIAVLKQFSLFGAMETWE
jgi:hypothetical protein